MKIGLFFGSFNPVHIGHMAIANYMLEYTDMEQIWFVVSPQNPFKQKNLLLPDYQRLEILEQAISKRENYYVSNIEFNLPKPSFTIDTLAYLYDKYPKKEFSLIMGGDNLEHIEKWKNYTEIFNYHQIYMYPRPGHDGGKFKNHPKVTIVDAPVMEISSSFIRKSIREGKNIEWFLPEKAYKYICEMNFYKK